MKISELIKVLLEYLDQYGNLEVKRVQYDKGNLLPATPMKRCEISLTKYYGENGQEFDFDEPEEVYLSIW